MFVTLKRFNGPYQITIDDILNERDISSIHLDQSTSVITYKVDMISTKLKNKLRLNETLRDIMLFNEKYADLIDTTDKKELYKSFCIPKRSGGLRQIDAPDERLMKALNEMKRIFEEDLLFSHHAIAYAYINGRCTKDAVEKHRSNNSRWFLKTDLHSFFNSSSTDFVLKMLYQIYPLGEYVYNSSFKREFEKMISLCFLNGGLPQGTPTSPMITNQMMIPIDYELSKMCHENRPHLVVTRYADDIHISSEYDFRWAEVQKKMMDILSSFGAPFTINKEKTHYGSRSGRNWMLGLMLNNDGKITVGHQKKKIANAMIHQFMTDYSLGKEWSLEDTQKFSGELAYFKSVEPQYFSDMIAKYNEKFHADLNKEIKSILAGVK